MKNLDTTTGEILTPEQPANGETRQLTEKEKNRAAQFERLLQASAAARMIKEKLINEAVSDNQAFFYESQPLNYFILKYIYKDGGAEFKKFNEWKAEGYTIKKGSKAFPVWSQPTRRDKKQGDQASQDEPRPRAEVLDFTPRRDENGEIIQQERERFNMCYLFSNLQVVKKETETAEAETEAAPLATFPPVYEPEPIAVF